MSEHQDRRSWLIIIGLSLGPLVSVGFARFAYGLILPAMQQELDWSFTAAGWLNTANAIGYLVGAMLALKYIPRLGAGWMFSVGMVITSVAVLCSGLTSDLWLLTVYRIIAGVAGAPVFIAGGVLASGLFVNNSSRNALGIAVYFGGVGIGMLLTGLSIPLVLEHYGSSAWPQTWLLLGVASAFALPASLWAVRSAQAAPKPAAWVDLNDGPATVRALPALLAYFMFGVGYFVYMTFLVAWMRAQGESVNLVIATWSAISVMVILSPFIWRKVLAASAGGGAMALAMVTIGAGTLLPLLVTDATGLLLSAMMFGVAFAMIPTAITSFIKKNYPQAHWGAAMSLFTIFFAVGQIIGPIAAGLVADQTHSLAPGMTAAGGVLLAGAVMAVLQKPLK